MILSTSWIEDTCFIEDNYLFTPIEPPASLLLKSNIGIVNYYLRIVKFIYLNTHLCDDIFRQWFSSAFFGPCQKTCLKKNSVCPWTQGHRDANYSFALHAGECVHPYTSISWKRVFRAVECEAELPVKTTKLRMSRCAV